MVLLPSVFHWRCQSLTRKERQNSPACLTIKSVFMFNSKYLCVLVTFLLIICVRITSTLLLPPPTETGQVRELIECFWIMQCHQTKRKGLPCDWDRRSCQDSYLRNPSEKVYLPRSPTFQEVLSFLMSAPNFSASCCSFPSLSRVAWSFSWERGITPKSRHGLSWQLGINRE